ncbi:MULTISPECIES: trypco2 family protein [unclassified Novosphingobium]|uniref:trypco2 family protein n=1 Tax=unclassified Novosphingobium TaxID=2644732 RepID=UPI0025E8D96A|nr:MULTISPECIES: trypco2 family protein [unclassified Novosphingobium]HQS70500.1 hypothetical protein [Novosphingobium sp.]
MTEEADTEELSAFVASTLRAIAEGVSIAQRNIISSAHGTGTFAYAAPKDIEFDIAVSAKKIGTVGGGLKVAVFGIGANAKGEEASESSTVSRIRFSVPTSFKRNASNDAPIPTKSVWGED